MSLCGFAPIPSLRPRLPSRSATKPSTPILTRVRTPREVGRSHGIQYGGTLGRNRGHPVRDLVLPLLPHAPRRACAHLRIPGRRRLLQRSTGRDPALQRAAAHLRGLLLPMVLRGAPRCAAKRRGQGRGDLERGVGGGGCVFYALGRWWGGGGRYLERGVGGGACVHNACASWCGGGDRISGNAGAL